MSLRPLLVLALSAAAAAAEPAHVIDLWPGTPPGEFRADGPEKNMSKPGEGLVAGRELIRLGNVSKPQLHLFLPPGEKANECKRFHTFFSSKLSKRSVFAIIQRLRYAACNCSSAFFLAF